MSKIIIITIIIIFLCDINSYEGEDMVKYIINNDSGTIKAVNGITGITDYSSTDVSIVLKSINYAISGGETIIIRSGTYNPGSSVTFTKSIKLKGEGNVIFKIYFRLMAKNWV